MVRQSVWKLYRITYIVIWIIWPVDQLWPLVNTLRFRTYYFGKSEKIFQENNNNEPREWIETILNVLKTFNFHVLLSLGLLVSRLCSHIADFTKWYFLVTNLIFPIIHEWVWMILNNNSRTKIKESQGSRPSNRVIPEKILFYTNSINSENLKKIQKIKKFSNFFWEIFVILL